MGRAIAVIGANFGSEGKGLVTDYLCARDDATLVVRYNGGAQAGHTVCTPEGYRHVFSQLGAGTFLNVPTFLSRFVVVNPTKFVAELDEFEMLGSGANISVYADPNCRVTTPIDILINQAIENHRGFQRHGSAGLGFNETIERNNAGYIFDIHHLRSPDKFLDVIRTEWLPRRLTALGLPHDCVEYTDEMHEQFLMDCDQFSAWAVPAELKELNTETVLFEGCQGLLLGEERREFFPHITRSKPGMHNVRTLCADAGIDDIDGYYVSRTYMTRHGPGPFPTEMAGEKYEDDTNLYNAYQGALRYGRLIPEELHKRCFEDFGKGYKLVLTHCDQLRPSCEAVLYFSGPTRDSMGYDGDISNDEDETLA